MWSSVHLYHFILIQLLLSKKTDRDSTKNADLKLCNGNSIFKKNKEIYYQLGEHGHASNVHLTELLSN